MYEENFYKIPLDEYIDFGKMNKEWLNKNQAFNNNQKLLVNKQDVINQTGTTKNWRKIAALKQRENISKPRFFEYDKADYNDKVKTVSSPREIRNLIKDEQRYKFDPKKRKQEDFTRQNTLAMYNNINRSIGVNKGLYKEYIDSNKEVDETPIINHELQHYKQDMLARSKYGKQASVAMFSNNAKQTEKPNGVGIDNYMKSPLEYNANMAGLNYGKNPNDTSQIIRQSIKPKRFNRPIISRYKTDVIDPNNPGKILYKKGQAITYKDNNGQKQILKINPINKINIDGETGFKANVDLINMAIKKKPINNI